jgi:hypothetical protein
MLLECWTRSQRQQLQDEQVSQVGDQRAARLRKALRQLKRHYSEFANLTHTELMSAHFLIQTRSFFAATLSRYGQRSTTPAHAVLVPVLDMLNTDMPSMLNAREQLMYGQTSHEVEAISVLATVRTTSPLLWPH